MHLKGMTGLSTPLWMRIVRPGMFEKQMHQNRLILEFVKQRMASFDPWKHQEYSFQAARDRPGRHQRGSLGEALDAPVALESSISGKQIIDILHDVEHVVSPRACSSAHSNISSSAKNNIQICYREKLKKAIFLNFRGKNLIL